MASDQIEQTVASNHFSVTLLRGVTGSGKTEVFLSVASKFISEARQVLILVPEIGLSSGLVSRIFKILGNFEFQTKILLDKTIGNLKL